MPIGLQKVPLTGGVNIQKDAMDVADNQLVSAENFVAHRGTDPGVRNPMRFVREVIPDYRPWDSSQADALVTDEKYHRWAYRWRPMRFMFPTGFGDVVGVFTPTDAQPIIHADGSVAVPETLNAQEACLWMMPGVLVQANANGGPYVFNLGGMTRCPSLFQFDGVIYAFGGTNEGGHIAPEAAGLSNLGNAVGWNYYANQWNTAQLERFIPDGAAVIRDRVLYYKGIKTVWSDKGDPLQIGENALTDWFIPVAGEEQESITAAAELSTSADGSPVQSVAAVWTKTRCFMLLGEPAQTVDDLTTTGALGSLQINRLNLECGCVSQATVTRTPYGTFWVGTDDVWFMPFGSLPVRVGTNIRPALQAVPPALAWRLFADYEDGFLRIVLPGAEMDGSGPLTNIWMLNLNDGPPQNAESAQWWGPQVLCNGDAPPSQLQPAEGDGSAGQGTSGIWCFARDQRATGDGKLYSLQPYKVYAGGGSPWDVFGMTLVGWDQPGERDRGAPDMPYRAWQGTTAYFEGDIIVPRGDTTSPRAAHFVCTVAGTSAGTEPAWYTTAATTIVDGTVTWRPVYHQGGATTALGSYKTRSMQHSNFPEWSILSKEYTLGDGTRDKLIDGAELGFSMGAKRQQLTYTMYPRASERSRICENGTAADLVLDSNAGLLPGTLFKRRKLLSADPTARIVGLTAGIKIDGDAGIVIVEGFNDTVQMYWFGDVLQVTIAAGFYEDITDVWDAIKAFASTYSLFLESTIDTDGGAVLRASFGFKHSGGTDPVGIAAYTPLSALFGYTPDQIGTNSAAPATFYSANDALTFKQLSDFHINTLNIRFGTFGRGPV